MKFTQQMVGDLLTGWQNLSSIDRDWPIRTTLFPNDYSRKEPPRFSQNIKNDADTEKLLSKLMELGLPPIKINSLPRSCLSVVCCGNVVVPPMPYHKAIGFIGYCVAVSNSL